jgi:hypothetical protein
MGSGRQKLNKNKSNRNVNLRHFGSNLGIHGWAKRNKILENYKINNTVEERTDKKPVYTQHAGRTPTELKVKGKLEREF